MRNEKDRQEKYLNYFDQNQQNSQRNQSRRQQEQTQWFSPEDDEDIKLADDSFDEEDDFDPAPPRKRRRQSKLSRFAQSFVLICVFVGVAVFLAYFALVTASDLLGLGQTDQQIEVTLTEEDAASLSRTADVLEQNGVISSKLVFELYARSPRAATDWFYAFSGDTNYIRRDRIARDLRWQADSPYGTLDISINLSKPEKDPKAIAAAKAAPQSGYPKCQLCRENEGYAGRMNHPARRPGRTTASSR